MTEKEILLCLAASAAALFIGMQIGKRREQAAAASSSAGMGGDSTMAWFINWGKPL